MIASPRTVRVAFLGQQPLIVGQHEADKAAHRQPPAAAWPPLVDRLKQL
jgi:hypothetical protein